MTKITLFKSMLFAIVILISGSAFGQGVFTSLATGNWNAAGSWTLSSGSDADGIPDADDNVTITTHSITVPTGVIVACNNITVNNTTQRVLMQGAGSVLEIYGTLNAAATPTIETIIDCTADATAKVVFKRTTSGALFGATWAAIGTGLRFEVNLPTGITGTTTTAVKAREIIVTSGTFALTGGLRPDNGSANGGILTIQDGAIVSVTAAISRTGTTNTPFASLTINGTGKIIVNGTFATSLPTVASGFPVYTFSSGAVIEYQGGAQTIGDINYPNLIINATTASNAKTWSPAANRTATSITVTQGILAYGNGVTCTVSGNILIAANGTISTSSSANRFAASGAGRTFTLNGTARVTANETQTPAATSPFSYQYNNFASYTFSPTSWVSFRSPTTTAVTQGIDGITGSSFGNVEIAGITNLTAAGSNTHTVKTNLNIVGNLAFPRIAANTSLIINFGAFTTKVGGAIQLNGSNASTQSGGRTYNMGTSTIELNGSTAQNTLGGTDLPTTFTNLKLNNSAGVTVANAVTVSGMLTLAGNNSYTSLNNITGYSGLEYAATVSQTTGSEFGSSITNLTINNSNGVTLGGDKTVTGALALTSGTLQIGANTLTLQGATSGAGFMDGSTGTVIYNGSSAQSVSNLTSNSVKSLTINNAAGATLAGNVTVTDALTLTAGTLATDVNNLTLDGTTSGAGFINTGASGTLTFNGANTQTLAAANLTSGAVNNLVVNAGSKLTTSGTIAATNLTLNSSASGTATLVDNGTLTATTANVKQYLPLYRSWYMTSPMTGTSTVPVDNNSQTPALLKWYDETLGDPAGWTTATGMKGGTGYILNPGTTSGASTLTFTGTINNGNIPVDLTRSSVTKAGFNLVGNPYPSHIVWTTDMAASANLLPSIWYRTAVFDVDHNAYSFETYNAAGTIAVPEGATPYIPPMQGFWVKVDDTHSTGQLTFTNAMRSHKDANPLKAPSVKNAENKILRLQVTGGNRADEAVVYFNSKASNTFDRYDSQKMLNGSTSVAPDIYTLVGTEKLVINGMPTIPYDTEIPLGFSANASGVGSYKLKMTEITNFDAGTNVYIKNNATGFQQLISDGSEYDFSPVMPVGTATFSLIFKAPGAITDITKAVNEDIQVYVNSNNQIVIKNKAIENDAVAFIYNSAGQLLISQQLTGNSTVLAGVNAAGVYIVKINNVSHKIIIK